MNYFKKTYENWKSALSDKRFTVAASVTAVLTFLSTKAITSYLPIAETKAGAFIPDPILLSMEAVDLTIPIFAIMYLCSLAGVALAVYRPVDFVRGALAYAILMAFRHLTMYLLPLEAPPGIIPLADPFIEEISNSPTLTKDLFFSGHTSTMFLLFLALRGRATKAIFLTAAVLVGLFVVLQHVHYTIDVVAAPVFAYCSFVVSSRVLSAAKVGGRS